MIFTSASPAAAWRQEKHREICRDSAWEASPHYWRCRRAGPALGGWPQGAGREQNSERVVDEFLSFCHWRSSSTLNPFPPPAPSPPPLPPLATPSANLVLWLQPIPLCHCETAQVQNFQLLTGYINLLHLSQLPHLLDSSLI